MGDTTKSKVENTLESDEDILENMQIEKEKNKMIAAVVKNPLYVQCLLHIKAYRDYHKGEKDEFLERIEVIDERYNRYAKLIDSIQISIIVLSAFSAFIQAANPLFNISDVILQFIALCVGSYSALILSISKYYKLDEQKEEMNNLRTQCTELVGQLGAREDRLNRLCTKEIWAGPVDDSEDSGKEVPAPAYNAWENERDDMFTALKPIIEKKQTLVSLFDKLMDSQEAKELIYAAKRKSLEYKKKKLQLDEDFLIHAKNKEAYLVERSKLYKEKKGKITDMSQIKNTGRYGATPKSFQTPIRPSEQDIQNAVLQAEQTLKMQHHISQFLDKKIDPRALHTLPADWAYQIYEKENIISQPERSVHSAPASPRLSLAKPSEETSKSQVSLVISDPVDDTNQDDMSHV